MKKGIPHLFTYNLLIICQFAFQLYGQEPSGSNRKTLQLPVDIPIFLAGNFAEPRLNHFHSGIDIKTNGTTGIPVRSVSEGYVSRIKVEAGGYGKAVYIRHPDGYTTLYGHLLSFSDNLSQYVKEEQYRRESFAVDLFPEPAKFVIKKGQVIALSGNSGSSEGPHLHFEVRETQSENPINPLVKSIDLPDGIPPVIEKLYVFSLKERRERIRPVSEPLKKSNGVYRPLAGTPVPFDNVSGIGIETYDLLNGSDNHCGIYRIKGYLDDKIFFETCLDKVSFSETRYMNSFMDYKMYTTNHKTIIKLFIDPNNKASVYRFARNRGQLELKDKTAHKIKITVDDAAGNQSVAIFDAILKSDRFQDDPDFNAVYNAFFKYGESNTYQAEGIEVVFPPGALYDDIYFDYAVESQKPGSYSPLHQIHRMDVPVHLYYRLAIESTNLPPALKPKATLVQCLGNNKYNILGGNWEGNRLVSRTRNFGAFCIMVDTVKPVIKPLNFSSANDLKTLSNIKLKVKDDLSGVQTYRGEIDGKWILLEYDARNSILEYKYDSRRNKSGIQHRLAITVSDQLANSTTYTISFFR
jgi:hypothetical protein